MCIKKHQFNLNVYIKDKKAEIIFLIVWLISQVYEINGGRGNSLQNTSNSYIGEISNTIKTMWGTIKEIKTGFVICVLILLLSGLFLIVKEKEWDKLKEIILLLLALTITELYLVLSCAKAGAWYISRPDVFYGIFFFGMMIVIICFITVASHFHILQTLIPLFLVIIFFDCDTSGKTFLEANVRQSDPDIVYAVNNDILKQMLDAQEKGLDSTDIYVPVFNSDDNWPYATYATYYISGSLYKLGVLDYNLQVTSIIPVEEKNKELHIK